jgi:hypothetical protein
MKVVVQFHIIIPSIAKAPRKVLYRIQDLMIPPFFSTWPKYLDHHRRSQRGKKNMRFGTRQDKKRREKERSRVYLADAIQAGRLCPYY